ncbi:MAG: DciA family protein [Sphingomonadales bacterium]
MSANQTSTRRGYSRKVGTLLPKSANKIFRRYGFAEGTLVRRWREIAGPNLSQCTLPLKITYGKERGEKISILHLLVEPAAALEVQHQIPVLIEKIKIFYGNQSIARIALIQGPGTIGKAPTPDKTPQGDPQAVKTMETWTKAMKASGLKDSLISLGEQILMRE